MRDDEVTRKILKNIALLQHILSTAGTLGAPITIAFSFRGGKNLFDGSKIALAFPFSAVKDGLALMPSTELLA